MARPSSFTGERELLELRKLAFEAVSQLSEMSFCCGFSSVIARLHDEALEPALAGKGQSPNAALLGEPFRDPADAIKFV